jgi:hypothetical protein
VSWDVPFTALTSNQFMEGMKKIFELEPFIKLRVSSPKFVVVDEENFSQSVMNAS